MKPVRPLRVVGRVAVNQPKNMKISRRTLLPLAGILFLGAAFLRADDSAATPPPPPGEHHGHHSEMRGDIGKMAAELNLTAAQQTQIEAIRKQTWESMKAIRNDSTLTEDQKRDKSRELRKSGMQQEWAILTPEQQ
ncbi:MAG: Spy/CpxP family protein refolding chaperone, partial [Lacunisphaera sp.]